MLYILLLHYMAAKVKHDWQAIKDEYVLGYRKLNPSTGHEHVTYPTYKELSDKYKVSETYLRTKAGKEGWSRSKESIQETTKFKNLEGVLTGELSESAQFDARILWNTNRLLAAVEAFFDKYDNLQLGADGNFRFVDSGYSENENDPIHNIKVSDLKGLVDVLDKTQSLVRRTLGEPTKTTKVDLTDASIETLLKQRENLVRQQDGLEYQIEQLEKEIADG